MKSYHLIFIIVFFFNFCVFSADVAVVKQGAVKTAIDLSSWNFAGAVGNEIRKIIEADLHRSGWFEIVKDNGAVSLQADGSDSGGIVSINCLVTNEKSKRIFLRRSYKDNISAARRLAHLISDDIVQAVKNTRGFSSSKLTMVGVRKGIKEIYICDSDGFGLIQLTQDKSVCLSPSWTPDGKSIVYTSYVAGFPDVYRIELESGKRKRIVAFPGLNTGARVSPDGKSIAVILSKDGNPELYVIDLRDGRLNRLTTTYYAAEASPVWSPDGRQIAYVSDKSGTPQIYVMDRTGSGSMRITHRGSQNVAPDWSPSGKIAFSSMRDGRYHICVYDPASRSETQFTYGPFDHEDPSWAPDSRHIAYVRTERNKSDIYLLDTGGDPQIKLTNQDCDWRSPSWSP